MEPINAPSHTDIKTNGWIGHLPACLRPYALLMRLDRPIGTWLLLLPSWWTIAAAGGGITKMSTHHWALFALFGVGSIIMRGAGCIINDLWDRDLDKQVERTKTRPLAAGTVTPRQALLFCGVLLALGLSILIQLTPLAQWIGVLSLIPVILYPLAKRVTWYPQAVLGLTFNIGALMGWAAVTNTLPLSAWLIYIAGLFWTLGYDTIYAHQDKDDDGIVGIKSTALKFGDKSHGFIAAFYGLTLLLLNFVGTSLNAGPLFFILWALVGAHILWQVRTAKFDNPVDCLKKFRSNRETGFLILAAFLCGFLV